jgi:aldehyde dehydrogenase (NAD+)
MGMNSDKAEPDIERLVKAQREYLRTGSTRDISLRLDQLRKLKAMIEKYQEEMVRAVADDLEKPRNEMLASEIALTLKEIEYTRRNLKRWAAPHPVKTAPVSSKASAYLYPEPYGVALIMAPWNYPFLLLLQPLVGSIAAGNCTVLKPSEISWHSSHVIAEMIAETFEPLYIAAVEGGMEVNRPLLAEKFDYILFTGSTAVGRAVMEAAARHLTPVTLELGGKSPCIVDSDAPLEYAANRIVWGKFINAGQTCIAPDYLLAHADIKEQLLEAIKRNIGIFYGEDPSRSPNYGRIINERHFQRLVKLLEEGDVITGGESNPSELYIAPTVIDNLTYDAPVMEEEIFGPILPVFTYHDLEEAISIVNSRPRPLALYLFSVNTSTQERILRETSCGGVTINSTLLHMTPHALPYGGVGESGMGTYHGKHSFDTFTHYKSVLNKGVPEDFMPRPPS